MDQHLRVYLEWAARWRAGECGPEDVFVWWAKLRSPRREEPIPHGEDVLALQEQIDAGAETLTGALTAEREVAALQLLISLLEWDRALFVVML